MAEYFHNLKKYLTFSNSELRTLVIIIFLYGFVLGFNDGSAEFVWYKWTLNLIFSIVMVAIVIIAHELGRKMMAIKLGYTVEFKPVWILVITSLALSYFSNGFIEFLLPATGMMITHHEKLRIGKFRYGQNYYDNAFIAFMGCYANVIMALILKGLSFLPSHDLIMRLIYFNIMYAVVNFAPLDILFVLFRFKKIEVRQHSTPLDGTYILYASRIFYVFAIGAIAFTSGLLLFSGIIFSVITGVIIAAIISIMYAVLKEGVL